MKPSDLYNIVIFPTRQIQSICIETSTKISQKFPTEFLLNPTDRLPHITLYQALFPTKNLSSLKMTVQQVAWKTVAFSVELHTISVFLETFVFWNAVNSPALRALHEEIVASANPLRDGLVNPALYELPNLTDHEKSDRAEFGSLLIGKRYMPHITLTRLKNPEDKGEALRLAGQPLESFPVTHIALSHLGAHGTVTGIIETFPLKK